MIAVSEAWLVQRVSSSFVAVDGYYVERRDVQELTRKHKVFLHIIDSFKYTEIDIACQNIAAVPLLEYDLWVLSLYRPPSYGEENVFLTSILCDFREGREVVILGILIFPIVWSDKGGILGGERKVDKITMDCFTVAGLKQWVLEPILVSSCNTLYLFLTSELYCLGAVKGYTLFPKYCHNPVVCDYLFRFDYGLDTDGNDEIKLKYLWHREDYCLMSNALSRMD